MVVLIGTIARPEGLERTERAVRNVLKTDCPA